MSAGAKRRDKVASFIESYAAKHGGQSPSLQEIGDALKISKATADRHVQLLIAEGRARRSDGKLWLTQPPLFSPLED
jgi:predicted ArsR family transcriptional regulator